MPAFKKRKVNSKGLVLVACLAVVCALVGAWLFYLRMAPSVALEQELRCGMEEHVHGDGCYEGEFLVCKKPIHAHDGNCYIVLLNENDINGILTMLGGNRSLETVITDVMSTALTFNRNLNSAQSVTLSQNAVEELNNTISEEETLPDIVLNKNINSVNTLAAGNTGTGNTTYALGDDPVTSNYNANFYVYLDGEWTCIGSLPFTTTSSWGRYNSTLPTAEVLALVNGALGTSYNYEAFDIAVSSSLNNNYSKDNIGMGSTTTTLANWQNNSTARSAKYVRLIPNNDNANSNAFAFYTVKFLFSDGSQSTRYVKTGETVTLPTGNYTWSDGRNTYEAGETVTITGTKTFTGTELGPITYISVNYNINFPTVSGVTVSTAPTMAGLATGTVTDGYEENKPVTLRNVSQQTVLGKVNGNNTGLSRVIQFRGWRVGNTDMLLQPNTTLVWEELLHYASGDDLQLTAVWEYDALQTASFFVRFDSVAVDTEGNVTGQDSNLYTNELFAAFVGGVDPSRGHEALHNDYHIVDTTSDNSFGADQAIRALYGEKTEGAWLSAFPQDDAVFEQLKAYARTGHLLVDGKAVDVNDLNKNAYAIRWYVFKAQSDAWHIDGKLVRKEGLIHVYKTFAGNKALIAEAKTDFYIDATDVTTGVNTVLNLQNRTSYDAATDTYMWEITNVDYGEEWRITEHPHVFLDGEVQYHAYTEYIIMDSHGEQSTTGTGTSLTVTGMTYALDEGTNEVLRAEFTNIYNKSDSILIKKQDARTGVSIGGATFRLLQNGQALKFNYNAVTGGYEYDPENGAHTVLSGTANGYFELLIEDFSYDEGPITVQEVDAPTGYAPVSPVQIGYVDNNDTVGILGGNSELIKYTNGILIVGNSTDALSVTAEKTWDCPETEWQPVTVQLLANGKLVTTVVAGAAPMVVLNADNAWQYTWENLPVYVNGEKINWSIRETQIGTEMAKADGSFVNWLVSYGLPMHGTDEDGGDTVRLTVTNTTKRVMLRLTKTDIGRTVQLPGATFLLEAVDANGALLSGEVSKTATTGESGTLIFDNLKCGVRYRLTETAAPTGFLKTEEYMYFTIQEGGAVTVEESYFAEAGATAYNILVRNASGVPLPESGGAGLGMYYAFGCLLCLAAGIYIGILRKRRCHR